MGERHMVGVLVYDGQVAGVLCIIGAGGEVVYMMSTRAELVEREERKVVV